MNRSTCAIMEVQVIHHPAVTTEKAFGWRFLDSFMNISRMNGLLVLPRRHKSWCVDVHYPVMTGERRLDGDFEIGS